MKVDKSLQYEQQLQAEHEQFELMKIDLEYADFRKNRDDYNAICRTVDALDTSNKAAGRRHYSTAEKVLAASAYLVYANSKEVERQTGISADRVRYWKTRASWWPAAIEYARSIRNDEWDSKYSKIRDLTINGTIDRLEKGDVKVYKETKVNKETGEKETVYVEKRVPISAKDQMIIGAMAAERQALMKGDPTSIVKKQEAEASTPEAIAQSIADKISAAIKESGTTIEGVVLEKKRSR